MSARLSAVESEREVLRQDKRLAGQGRDIAIRAAWKTRSMTGRNVINVILSCRDEAVERKNAAEVELARCRVESMQVRHCRKAVLPVLFFSSQVSSQLLEAVQQKVQLSTELDAWEGDLQQTLHSQLHHKLENSDRKSSDEDRKSSSGSEGGRKLSRILGSFFSRGS